MIQANRALSNGKPQELADPVIKGNVEKHGQQLAEQLRVTCHMLLLCCCSSSS